jgi:ELWxxDGT repeat protein
MLSLTSLATMGMGTGDPALPVTVSRLANISTFEWNGQTRADGDSNPRYFTWFKNQLVFAATDIFGDTELYSYDGHEVRLLADINQTVKYGANQSSSPAGFVRFGEELIFAADDGIAGRELWSYDGHRVRMLADLNSGTEEYDCVVNPRSGQRTCSVRPKSSNPLGLTVFGNELVFSADDGQTGQELWSYDGRQVRRLADINQTTRNGVNQSSSPSSLTVFGRELVFRADDGTTGRELWGYDGRTVRQIANINQTPAAGGDGSSAPGGFLGFGGQLVFSASDGIHGGEVWTYDGREVRMAGEIRGGPLGCFKVAGLVGAVLGNEVLFPADDGVTGEELWSWDGRTLRRVADINPGAGASAPSGLTTFGGELVFAADNGQVGRELWSYNGREVRLVAEINPTVTIACDYRSYPPVCRTVAQSSAPFRFTVFGNRLVFVANNGTTGWELWSYDGQSVRQAADINPFPAQPDFSRAPNYLMVFQNELIFSADDGKTGIELWRMAHGAAGR